MTDWLSHTLDGIIGTFEQNVSVLVKVLGGDTIYAKNESVVLPSASLIKLPIMLAVLDEVKHGSLRLSDKIFVSNGQILPDSTYFESGECYRKLYDIISFMIIVSDNTCANVLMDLIGTDAINDYIRCELGLKSTSLGRKMLDFKAIEQGHDNYISQYDMLLIFERLFGDKILNGELCTTAKEILFNQRCQNQIMRYISVPVSYAHKTGELDLTNHDAGVMIIHGVPCYVGVSVHGVRNSVGMPLSGLLGQSIYEYLSK